MNAALSKEISLENCELLIREGKRLSKIKPAQAIPRWQEALAMSLAIEGTAGKTTLFCREHLANALLATNNFSDALTHCICLVQEYDAKPPKSAGTLVAVYQILARAYTGCEKFDDALATWKKAFDLSLAAFGAEHPATLYSERNFGRALLRLNRHTEALPIYQSQFARSYKLLPKAQTTALFARDLALCFNGLEQHHDAERLLKLALSIMRQDKPAENKHLKPVLNSLCWTQRKISQQFRKRKAQS